MGKFFIPAFLIAASLGFSQIAVSQSRLSPAPPEKAEGGGFAIRFPGQSQIVSHSITGGIASTSTKPIWTMHGKRHASNIISPARRA